MGEHVVTFTEAQVAALADKLDRFGEGLEDDERRVLVALLSGGLEQAGSESADVEGFAFRPDPIVSLPVPVVADPMRFAMLGDTIRFASATQLGRPSAKTGSQ